jgi:hypothetical protein
MTDGSQHGFAPGPHSPQAFPNTPRFSRSELKLMGDGGAVSGGGQFTHPMLLLIVFTTGMLPYDNARFPWLATKFSWMHPFSAYPAGQLYGVPNQWLAHWKSACVLFFRGLTGVQIHVASIPPSIGEAMAYGVQSS